MSDTRAARPADRVCVVTGGTRGIGLATARALAETGATVVLTGRDEAAAKDAAARVAAEYGVPVSGRALEVTDSTAVRALFADVAREHGTVDCLVANAGVLEDALIGMIRDDLVDRMLGTNVAGTLACLQAAARVMMRKRQGAIVLLASIVGERGNAGQAAYAASKGAVSALTKSAAKELGRYGIRVNAVAPGVIRTDMIAHLPDDLVAARTADTPLGRVGTADDVARAIRFLCGPDAAFVTGQILGVDGGLVL
ncbi:SDR family NAD(P)-dependent oxidoreductase [Yinghuangia seranimata]|uniref:SDR family NAD(P)-dependent oxidoreductase n=1 Tax=Yinghuangia seranimata TaxID=408067 RepID=UPI00248D06D3|nr:SDR family oxidoreductase [Yinghuangia seranimata]MDI2127386.1 SDR family oxidoreductase [Yinghuangia seranimata]